MAWSRGTVFRIGLLAVVVPLLVFNLFVLIGGTVLAVIPVLVEFPLIVSLVTKGRRQVFFAKLWSGLLAGGGAAGWLNTLANTGLRHLRSTDTDFGALEPSTLILNTSTLVLGVFVFVKCRNYLTSQTEQIRDMDCQ